MTRFILCYSGGEIMVSKYKVKMPVEQTSKKVADMASMFFDSWDWLPDGDYLGVEARADGKEYLLLALENANRSPEVCL